jgi:hypothetical protein
MKQTVIVVGLVAVLGTATQVVAARNRIECVALGSAEPQNGGAPVVADPDCTIATHALTAAALPDLVFSSATGCFTATVTGGLSLDGRPFGAEVVAYAGLSRNGPAADAELAGLPLPLFDDTGTLRFLISFTAATVYEVRSKRNGKLLGQFVTRDTGWAEVDTQTAVPSFISERQVITDGTGALKGARGELFLTGDQFGGETTVKGTICGRGVQRKLQKLSR